MSHSNNALVSVRTSDRNQFVNDLVSIEASQRPSIPAPKVIRLDGNAGTFSAMVWNNDKKEMEFPAFGDDGNKEFMGTILFVRYFAQWKWKDGARFKVRTREFSTFTEPVELLKIDKENKDSEPEIKTFPNYNAFKKAYVKLDDVTGEPLPSAFDFWSSLYIYVPSINEVVNYRFKGDTRTAFFDFMNSYKNDSIRHFVEAKTAFRRVEKTMPAKEGQEPKKYFAGTFHIVGTNSDTEMETIMSAFNGVKAWMNQFSGGVDEDSKPQDLQAEITKPNTMAQLSDAGLIHPEDEINLDTIPF